MKKLLITFILFFWLFNFSEIFAKWELSISPLRYEFEIQPGQTKKEKVRVTNYWDEAITVYSDTQNFTSWDETWTPTFIDSKDNQSNFMLSKWIKAEQQNITLAPKETQEITFEISIPENAEPGWHYAALFFGPWAPGWTQVAVVQRLWVLILVNVPWEVKISWELSKFELGSKKDNIFQEKDKFNSLPIVFQTLFTNEWNTHLKPKWTIILRDENNEILKWVWKEMMFTPSWAYLWEKVTDNLIINNNNWNVLPSSNRIFETLWEWFWYTILNEDWTKTVKFKSPGEYFNEQTKAELKNNFLMPWQQVKIKNNSKKITAEYNLYYEWKDKVKKEFNWKNKFEITYEEEYIWLNIYVLTVLLILIWLCAWYIIIILPKQKAKKEEKLKEKLLAELKNQEK